MSKLTSEGYDTNICQTEESELLLWEKKCLGDSSSATVLNTVFVYNCKLFGLRASDEHRSLEVSPIAVRSDQVGHYVNFILGKLLKTIVVD